MSRRLSVVLLVAACSDEPRLEGQVLDIWDNPIQGATVVMEGQPERPLTDAQGRFQLPLAVGTHRMKAGKEGYIQEHTEVSVEEGQEELPKVYFNLYKKPEEPGLYVIGINDYHRLEPAQVVQVGGQLESIRGVRQIGDIEAEGTRLQVLFHTPLKMDQVMRLGLTLHKMEWVGETKMAGPMEMTDVDVNLYRSTKEVPIEIKPLRSRNDYLIVTNEPLEPGEYAFDTQDLLTEEDVEAFKEIPEPLRVAYALKLR